MAMVGVDSGSLYRRTHSRLAWSWVGGRLAPFYIHQMNRVNSRNGSAMMTAPFHKHYYIISAFWRIKMLINTFGSALFNQPFSRAVIANVGLQEKLSYRKQDALSVLSFYAHVLY